MVAAGFAGSGAAFEIVVFCSTLGIPNRKPIKIPKERLASIHRMEMEQAGTFLEFIMEAINPTTKDAIKNQIVFRKSTGSLGSLCKSF
jgi:hypothetical protein